MIARTAPSPIARRPAALADSARELVQREPVLAGAALCLLAMIPPTLMALALDQRTVLGINPWIKPLKFEISLAIYLATLVWVAAMLPSQATATNWHRGYIASVVGAMALEMVWIGGASVLGVPSHFNVGTPMMGSIYGLMGVLAVLLTSPTLVYGVIILRDDTVRIEPAFRLSLGIGLMLTFVLTVIFAGAMASGTTHHVGPRTADQGGLLLMGWSRQGGDLRVAHFFATHALHAVPLFGWIAGRTLPTGAARGIVLLTGTLYAALVAATFMQARAGLPFLPGLG